MTTLDVINILFISVVSAFAGFGFNMMQTDGMIFEFYKEFLEQLPIIKDRKFPYDSEHKYYKKSKFLYYLTKPLGLCIVCNTTWIGIIISMIYFNDWKFLSILLSIFTGVASGGIVIIISNYYHKLQR